MISPANNLSKDQTRKHQRTRNLFYCTCLLLVVFAAMAASHDDRADTTTVILVRHAEKAVVQGDDPPLSDIGRKRAAALRHALEKAGVTAIYATQYQRTQQTVEPLAKSTRLSVTRIDATRTESLVAEIRRKHRGETVLIAGHSNTIPGIIKALGVAESSAIADSDYDDLFVVTVPKSGPARLLHLQYGAAD